MTKAFNRADQRSKRKALRAAMPLAEVILWSRLKGKQIGGHKFRRQYSVQHFVVDFYCPELRLAIEMDGDSHYTKDAQSRDAERQAILESFGIRFLRFTNKEVYENLEGVIEAILKETKA